MPPVEQAAVLLETLVVRDANPALTRATGATRSGDGTFPLPVILGLSGPALVGLFVEFLEGGLRVQHESAGVEEGAPVLRHTLMGVVENGTMVGLWGAARDVSEERRLLDQLRFAQKMEAIGHLVGGVVHDFNNLLTAILGYGELLREGLDAGNPQTSDLVEMMKAAYRAEGLLEQLLVFSRKHVRSSDVSDLNAVVHQFEPLIRRLIPENIEVVLDLAPELPMCDGDAAQLERVLLNLALNARDAMPKGGVLTIGTVALAQDDDADDAGGTSYARMTIGDTGTGMSPETQARIFEPFFTTKGAKGTGLGLSTVKAILKQFGGRIGVTSASGRGTTFQIDLPVVAAAEPDAPAAEPDQALTPMPGLVAERPSTPQRQPCAVPSAAL
jgi:signal transduction histidine kinase